MSETALGILIGGTVFTLSVWGFIGWMALNRYRRPEREPVIDYDAIQRELDQDFGTPAEERQGLVLVRAARLSA